MNETAAEKLAAETVSMLSRAAGNAEAIGGAVFLYLNRAYELGFSPDFTCDLLGTSEGNILSRVKLSKADEQAVLEAYATIDPILTAQYGLN
jgi:hypothetical protein